VQVDPIKITLKPPGNKRLKLKCDQLLSNSAFKFNLRRSNKGNMKKLETELREVSAVRAGAYTPPLYSST